MTKKPLGAQISHLLKARGVDVIFGIPGVHNVELYRGIEEAGITHVLARHEQGAGFMADGYARASGKPGVAYVITGPGVCNITTAMGQANSDSVPILVVASCLDEVAARKGQLHQMTDQRAAAASVCDWAEEAQTASSAYQLVERAFVEFASARGRAKYIQVPIAVLGAPVDAPPDATFDAPDYRPQANAQDVAQVVELLAAAKRAIFVFGGGAAKASAAAREVLALCNAASFTSYAGRGVVAPDDALHFGSALAKAGAETVFEQADLVICVGTELAEVDLWRETLGHSCKAVHVDIDAAVLARGHGGDLRIMADSGAFLTALAAGLEGRTPASTWRAADVAAARARWRAETDAARPGIVPIIEALQECLPDDTMIFSDMTQFAYVSKDVWPMAHAGHWHHPFGFGTLGYALPAAIGGAMARKGAPTLCIAGDYGFQYTVQELGAAVELGLPLPIILWDNGKLKEIEDSMVRSQIAPNAVVAHNPDFCALAEAYGARSAAPETLEALQAAVLAALKADGPTLIYVTPAMSAGL